EMDPQLGRVGVWSTELRADGPATSDAARVLESAGWGTLWIPNAGGKGLWADAERLLAATSRITIATGVASIWGDEGDDAPTVWNRLVSSYGRRLVTGFGVSGPDSARAAGASPTTPLRDMTTYLDRLDRGNAIPANSRLLGALGPKMVALAAHRTAGIHPFLVTPASVRAQRDTYADLVIAPHLGVVLDSNASRARDTARHAVGIFFGFPAYRANLQRLGFSESDLTDGGSDQLIDAVTAHGSLDTIAERITTFLNAGADHVALQVLGHVGPGLPTQEWEQLAELTSL
ncbi:TIGR03620 family F420-dependent LLM class oxidoreductase, partial [Micromonospora parva]